MGLVMGAFLAVIVVIAILWVLSLKKSVSADQAEQDKRETDQNVRRLRAEEEARLLQKGALLHCMGCGAEFRGPLADDGCPECHIRSLVVSEAEYRRVQQNSTEH